MRRLSGLLLLAPLAAHPLAQSAVWVVDDDPGPGVDFNDFGDAVTAASPGDLLLVRDGTYGSLFASSKPLFVVADTGANVSVDGLARLTNDNTFVRGLDVALQDSVEFALRADGRVWVEDCTVGGLTTGPFLVPGCANLRNEALLVHSRVEAAVNGVAAVYANQNAAFVYGSELTGTSGAPALELTASDVYLFGSTLEAGAASSAIFHLFSFFFFPEIHLLGTTLIDDCEEICGVDGATVVEHPGSSRSLELSAPVRPGETLTETFTGEPDDFALVLVSFGAGDPLFVEDIPVPYHLGNLAFVTAKGLVGPSGALVDDVPIGPISGQAQFVPIFMQGLFLDTAGEFHLSNPSFTVILQDGL